MTLFRIYVKAFSAGLSSIFETRVYSQWLACILNTISTVVLGHEETEKPRGGV